jgi:ribokinase
VFDFVARAARLPRKGETILGDAFGMFPGGKGANQAVQASRLGAEVFLVGRVGYDFLGERLLAGLKENGVRTDFIRRDHAAKTAACCIHVDSAGANSIIIVPEANMACGKEDIDQAADVIQSADTLLCQLEIPVPTVDHVVRLAAERQVRVILNPAPARPVPDRLLAHVTVLTPNETEAEILSGIPVRDDGSVEKAGALLLKKGPQMVIVTLGERGAYLATRNRGRFVPAHPVTAVDTTAAGDAFSGALAVALAEDKNIDQAITFASAAGALAATRVGAQPSLPTRTEVEALLQGTTAASS